MGSIYIKRNTMFLSQQTLCSSKLLCLLNGECDCNIIPHAALLVNLNIFFNCFGKLSL